MSRRVTVSRCDRSRRECMICWFGPQCGPFYGIERVDIDTERPCPCDCHRDLPEALAGNDAMRVEPWE